MDKFTPKDTSKGAEEIVLTQIKQDFITPANAIFDYVDIVEKFLNDSKLASDDEIEDPMKLRIITRVNGEERQNGGTEMMIFDIPFVISYISRFTQLEPGDLICTGSPGGSAIEHDPPGYLEAGDHLEVEIDGIGLLKNSVQGEEKS